MVDTTKVDEDSYSGIIILSTHGSLKRKRISPPNACDDFTDNDTSYSKIVVKDDYYLLFPGSTGEKKYTIIELDYGENYDKLPCHKWERDNRSIPQLKAQAKRDYKSRLKN